VEHFLRALPETTKAIAVLDRTKEPGAIGEPLYQDVVTAVSEARAAGTYAPLDPAEIVGGRYGLSSKEFTPAMITRIFAELARGKPRNHFTIGIDDDVSQTSLDYDRHLLMPVQGVTRAIFYGLGSDGTVSANKNTIKIIGEETDDFVQGYFVYDSKRSGSRTTSHLRFGPKPIRSTYLVRTASFVACHQFQFVHQIDVLQRAAPGATFLLNSPYGKDDVWDKLPRAMQECLLEKEIRFHVIDAYRVAREANMGGRIDSIMQTCFFAISGVLPADEAIARIKGAIEKTYGRKGSDMVQKNFAAVDRALAELEQVPLPLQATSTFERLPPVSPDAPEFIRNVTAQIMIDRGDELPVSSLPVDGSYPTGSAAWEKRNISMFVPQWEPDLCIQCGQCGIVCPHSCIRSRFYDKASLAGAPDGFHTAPLAGRGFPDQRYTLQVYVEDCTGCALCVDACPAKSKTQGNQKAINMVAKEPILDQQRASISFFETLPESDRSRVDFSTVRGVQYLRPLFEFSGACSGCGETPYLKLLSQLFGDRLLVANATGCSSIYGGSLPTTPWSTNSEGRGPAWSNSLFEDNAEFGFGFRLTADQHLDLARQLLAEMKDHLGEDLVLKLTNSPQSTEQEIRMQRNRVSVLREKLEGLDTDSARSLESVADHLVRRSVWLVGGDGWAYDIGFGGLDHVLAAGRDVNVLVLDNEVYSNTGGQASKATPLGAVAKFSTSGKSIGKKDLALMAIAYGNAYVARVALGADPQQTLLAFREAEAYSGPSLILAYSHCIAHGINMEQGLQHQKMAVDCGYWPLFRYNPKLGAIGKNPIELDSPAPTKSLKEFTDSEMRFKILTHTQPERAEKLMKEAESDLKRKWSVYEFLASRDQ
jgi:pyruvate-ferredoxin/flavodoxin oxidoreductase